MVLYLDNSQLKQRINCKICPATCPEGENSSVDMTNHLLHVHSVYKYFRFFLYVLGKDQRDLALEEARICDSIRKKDSLIFF